MKLVEILKDKLPQGQFWSHALTLVDGCTKVSPGCQNCWSEAIGRRFKQAGKPSVFDGRLTLHEGRMADILPTSRNRKPRVYTYWNDIFHQGVDGIFRDKLFKIISESTDYHIICTKRPQEVWEYWNDPDTPLSANMYFPRLIFMVSMEDQAQADERMKHVLRLLAQGWKVGALVEPMLGPVDLQNTCIKCGHYQDAECPGSSHHCTMRPSLSWIVCGPENSKGKRPFDPAWAMRLQAQAKTANIPFLYKAGELNGKTYHETPQI